MFIKNCTRLFKTYTYFYRFSSSSQWVYGEHSNSHTSYNRKEIEDVLQNIPGEGSIDLSVNDEDKICSILINNPSKKNAFTGKMVIELRRTVDFLTSWKEGKAVIIYGAKNDFCSGSDLRAVKAFNNSQDGQRFCMYMQNTLTRLQSLPILSLALVEGIALGGGAELLTACDIQLVTPETRIQFLQKYIGLVPGWGGTTRLYELLGKQQTLKLLFSAVKIDPEMAMSLGLADGIVNISMSADQDRNNTITYSTCMTWLNSNFGFSKLDHELVNAIKSTICNVGESTTKTQSLGNEIEQIGKVWGGKANREAINRFRTGNR